MGLVTLEAIGNGLFAAGVLAALVAPWVRYRRATKVQRYQLKWFLTAAVLVISAWLGAGVLDSAGADSSVLAAVRTLPLFAIPLAVAVAFQPVRERLTRLANRLVFGQRATP